MRLKMRFMRTMLPKDLHCVARNALLASVLFLLLVWAPATISGQSKEGEEYEDFNFIAYGDTRSSDLPEAVSHLHEGIVQALNPNPQL